MTDRNEEHHRATLAQFLRAGAHNEAAEHAKTCRKSAEERAASAAATLTTELAELGMSKGTWRYHLPGFLHKANELHRRAVTTGETVAFWGHMIILVSEQRTAPDQVRELMARHSCFRCGAPEAWLYNRNPEYDQNNPGTWAMLCPDHWAHYGARPSKAKKHGYRLRTKHALSDPPNEFFIRHRGSKAVINTDGTLTIHQPAKETAR